MALQWTRTKDGDYNGKPVYEYRAKDNGAEFHIVWAYDGGGMFGYTARKGDEYLTKQHGIIWARTLKFCKAHCEVINNKLAAEQ
jgi:hypothetical protein